jgi:hypothetical protein
MGRCRHPNVFARRWCEGGDGQWIVLLGDSRDAHARRCGSCGAWLPLGPATDTPETAIEVRAAEIAANVADYFAHGKTHSIYIDEDIGWRVGVRDFDRPWSLSQQHAGYLARCIHDHEGAP